MAKNKSTKKRGIKLIDIIIIIIVGIILIVTIPKIKGKKNSSVSKTNATNTANEEYVTVLADGTKKNSSEKVNEDKKIEGLDITDTQITYNNGITNLLANVKNTTNKDQEMQEVTIVLLDNEGKELYRIPGVIEKVKAGETIQFNSSVTADFANAYDFKIIKK